MRKLLFLLFLFLAGNQLLLSQKHTTLYRYRNMPCAGDSIIKQQMEYINPGAAGRQISFSLHDAVGIAKAATNPVHRTAGHYTERLQMSGFLHGIYPLYVTVNGMVKTLHVMKK